MSYEIGEAEFDSICNYREFDYTDLKYFNPIPKGNGQNIIIKNIADENIIVKTPNIKIHKLLKNRIGESYMDLNISSDIDKKESKIFLKFIANIEENNELNIYNNSTKWFNNKQISYDTIDEYRKSSYSISSNGDIIFRVKYNKNDYKYINIGDIVNLHLHIDSVRFMKTRFYTEWVIIDLNKIELTDFNFCEDNLIMTEYNDLFTKEKSNLENNINNNTKKLEQENPEQEKIKQEKLEQERLEQEKLEQERLEQEKIKQEKLEQEKLEQEKLEQEKLKQERLEQERLEQEKLKQERLEQERLEQEKLEQEKLEQEKLEQEKLKQERLEQEKLKQERLEQEKLKQERLDQEKLEQEKLKQEKLKQERLEQEKLDQEKLEQEKLDQEKLEQEKLDQEKLEQEKLDQEKLEQDLENGEPQFSKLNKNYFKKHKLIKKKSKKKIITGDKVRYWES